MQERATRPGGERSLRLERYALRHLPDWLAQVNDPDVCRGVNRVYPVGIACALGEWLGGIRDRARGSALRFAVVCGRSFVGACGITGMSPRHADGWVNYWIGRDYWQRGYATAALRLLLVVAHDDLQLDFLYARCLAGNGASEAVLRSCGFARIGWQGFTERASGRQAGTLIFGIQLKFANPRSEGGGMENNFEQGKWIEHRPIVKHFNPDGVCATLVTEWLAAGGKIAKASFKRGTKTTQSTRIVMSQHADRNTTFHENGLSPMGSSEVMRATDAIDHVCTKPGYYYFKLCFKDGSGHALGVISEGGKFAVFDPNVGSSESLKSATELKLGLMQLVLAYMGLDKENWAGVEITQLKVMSFGEMAFHAQFM